MKIKKIRKKKAASVIAAALVLFLAGNGAASLTHQCLSNFSPKKEQVENWGLGFGTEGTQPSGNATPEELKASFQKELEGVSKLYKEITGKEMTKYYRPPQGKYSTENLKMAKELGYQTYFWSLAYVDWNVDAQPTKEEAFNKLLPRVHPGAIVLLHNTSKTNGKILDELLTKWEEMGYTFKPLSELK